MESIRSMAQQVLVSAIDDRLAAGGKIFGYVPCDRHYEPCADAVYIEAPDEAEAFEQIQVWIETGKLAWRSLSLPLR